MLDQKQYLDALKNHVQCRVIDDFPQIFKDLKYNNENNILLKQNTKVMPKDFFIEVEKTFEQFIDTESKHYPVTVEFANLIAWKI